MIVLDTNVLSEVLKPAPSPKVLNWLAAQERRATFTTATTKAEILFGVELLPVGKRRTALHTAVDNIFTKEFAGRVLAFDEIAARIYAKILAERFRLGRPMSQSDAQIAAISQSHQAMLATRNIRDFTDCGIQVFNPFT